MKILVLNCGGSSLKYQLIDMASGQSLAKGAVDRLGTPTSVFTHKGLSSAKLEVEVADYTAGIGLCLEHLRADGLVVNQDDIDLIAHKLAHGGERFTGAVLVTDEVLAEMKRLSALAPVHNPPSIKGIEQCASLFPNTPQAGVFETTFHHTVPDFAYTYGLPIEWRHKYGVRKYGFHGASHSYIAGRMAEIAGRDDLKVVSCHLGSGTSVAAISAGKSVDISSGLTPQSGTIMSTRPGDFDPWVFPFVMQALGATAEEANKLMVTKGGLLGISGISGDMRDLQAAEAAGDDGARLAIDVFCYQVRKYIGAFTAAMNGLDALVFTGGIGERSAPVRARICADMSFFGIEVDPERNLGSGDDFQVSPDGKPVRVQVITTNEELMVARQAAQLLATR